MNLRWPFAPTSSTLTAPLASQIPFKSLSKQSANRSTNATSNLVARGEGRAVDSGRFEGDELEETLGVWTVEASETASAPKVLDRGCGQLGEVAGEDAATSCSELLLETGCGGGERAVAVLLAPPEREGGLGEGSRGVVEAAELVEAPDIDICR